MLHHSLKLIWMISAVLLIACQNEYKPEFKAVTDQQITGVQKKFAKFSGTAVFTNSGQDTYTIDNLVADLIIDGKDAATLYYNQPREVRANSEFKLPLSQSFDNSTIIVQGTDGKFPTHTTVEIKGVLTMLNSESKKVEVPFATSETVRITVRKEVKEAKQEEKKTARELRREERKAAKEEKRNK